MNVGCSGAAGCGPGSGAGATCSAGESATFDPVHSRKLPHDPQKLSVARFENPHLVQTITWRSLDSQPARKHFEPSARTPGRARTGRRSVRAW